MGAIYSFQNLPLPIPGIKRSTTEVESIGHWIPLTKHHYLNDNGTYLSIYNSLFLSIYIYLSIDLFISLSISLIYLPICLSICPCIYLSIYVCI